MPKLGNMVPKTADFGAGSDFAYGSGSGTGSGTGYDFGYGTGSGTGYDTGYGTGSDFGEGSGVRAGDVRRKAGREDPWVEHELVFQRLVVLDEVRPHVGQEKRRGHRLKGVPVEV